MKDNALQLECGSVHTAKKDDEIKMPESAGKQKLRQWLNKNFRITMTDGRVLIGVFVCTDRDANIILGSCSEFLSENSDLNEERVLGLVMVPGRHIVSIQFDDLNSPLKRENTQDCNGEGVDHSTEII